MGAWGYHPAHNDGAQDEFASVFHGPIMKALRRCGKQRLKTTDDRWARVGVVVMAIERGFPVPHDTMLAAASDLAAIEKDSGWVMLWNDPKRAQRTIEKLKQFLSDAYDEHSIPGVDYILGAEGMTEFKAPA